MLGTVFRTVFLSFTGAIWAIVIAAASIDDFVSDVHHKLSFKPTISWEPLLFPSMSVRPTWANDSQDRLLPNYTLRGDSQASQALSSPLSSKFVTSRFARHRYHPIYRKALPHRGVDYGAPLGTPVMAVANGQISFVGHGALSGKMIKISHGPAKESRYLHLSGFSPRATSGQQVMAGDIIGYVGQTGLATGPHLHFEVWLDGKAVVPAKHHLEKLTQHQPPLWKSYHRAVHRSLTISRDLPGKNDRQPTEKALGERLFVAAIAFGRGQLL